MVEREGHGGPSHAQPRLWACVSCKGRVEFLRRTAPTVLGQRGLGYCLVDFDCPQSSGQLMLREYSEAAASDRLRVVRIAPQRYFHKARAHNAGAREAMDAGADYLIFLDADTQLETGFCDWLRPKLSPREFLIAGTHPNGLEDPGLVGLLVVPARAFVSTGGFDERFVGWGAEDLDLRLRLHLEQRLGYREIPLRWLTSLPHEDSLRTQFYAEKDCRLSNIRNHVLLANGLRRRGSVNLRDLDARGARLWRHVPARRAANSGPQRTVSVSNASAPAAASLSEHEQIAALNSEESRLCKRAIE